MAWADASVDASFASRAAADVFFDPALFVYLAWPTGDVFASTHKESITDGDGRTWAGVGRAGKVEPAAAEQSAAAQRWTVGLLGLPVDDSSNEDDAIGVDAEIYLGLFNEARDDVALGSAFHGFVADAGKWDFRKEGGRIVMDVSLTLGDQRNPRKGLIHYHAVGTGRNGDTAQRHLHTVEKQPIWPDE